MGGRNLFMELRPVNKDRCSHTSVPLTGEFLRSAKLRRSLTHQINYSFLVNGPNNRTYPALSFTIKQATTVQSGGKLLRRGLESC